MDPATEALVQCHRATLLVFGARFDEAAELGMGALSSVNDDSIVVRSLSPVGTSLVMSGRINEALALAEGALEPALRVAIGFPGLLVWAISARITSLFFAGRLDESLRLLDMAQGANCEPLDAGDGSGRRLSRSHSLFRLANPGPLPGFSTALPPHSAISPSLSNPPGA